MFMYMYMYIIHVHVHVYNTCTCMCTCRCRCTCTYTCTWCYRRCRNKKKKERKTPEAMEKWKMRVASGGIWTHDTLYSRQAAMYMYMYTGEPFINHIILLSQGRYIHVYMYIWTLYKPGFHLGGGEYVATLNKYCNEGL